MSNEIERKFYVKELPDLSNLKPLRCERYFLERGDGREVRISKINDKFIFEEKLEISNLERTQNKKEITKAEFYRLKQRASDVLVRDGYDIQKNPRISVKIYKGRHEGLIRAEVEFESKQEADTFQPLSWMGEEMTDLPIARDSSLLDLNSQELNKYLAI